MLKGLRKIIISDVRAKTRVRLGLYMLEYRCPAGVLDAHFTVESPHVSRAILRAAVGIC
jgi:hypothetical protein